MKTNHDVDGSGEPRLYLRRSAGFLGEKPAHIVIAVGDITMVHSGRSRVFVREPVQYNARVRAIRGFLGSTAALAFIGIAVYATVTSAWTMDDAGYVEAVSRADIPLIVLPQPIPRAITTPVSEQLTQPVRLIDKTAQVHDLNHLVSSALGSFDHNPTNGDRLHGLLVQTLAERQSDAYIHAALSAALGRGEFTAPPGLIDADGTFRTDVLLSSVLAQLGS